MNKLWFVLLFLGSAVQGMRRPVGFRVGAAALSTEIAYQEGKVGVLAEKLRVAREKNDELLKELRAMKAAIDDLKLVRQLDRAEFAIRDRWLREERDRAQADAQRSRDWGMELASMNERLLQQLRRAEAALERGALEDYANSRALVQVIPGANLPIPMPPR